MKKNLVIVVLVLLCTIVSAQVPKNMVEVYYFHGKRRCATCMSIEENSRKTVDVYFKDLKDKGIVKFIVIDIEDEKSQALVEKYEVTGSSLFVTRKSGGKTFTNDLTNFAFSYSRTDTPKFMKELKDKINEALNK